MHSSDATHLKSRPKMGSQQSEQETSKLLELPDVYYINSKPNIKKRKSIREYSFANKDANLLQREFGLKNFWLFSGPGWLMSIAYLDPGNLESDLQAAALCGNSLLWILFWAHFLGLMIQNLASQLGIVTGKHLAEHIRIRYPKPIAKMLWIMCELAIIGSDIQEVVGTAIAFNILFNFPLWLGVIITVLDTFTFLALHRYGMNKLESFFMSLIGVMAICFCFEMFLANPDPKLVMEGLLVPNIPKYAVIQAVAMVGAIIMPHNIYLHSALASGKEVCRVDLEKKQVKLANKYLFIESGLALFISFLINLALMVVFAKVFYYNNGSVPKYNVGLADAAEALANTLGDKAKYIWAIGLLAAGQSSTMTGTLAGQYVMEGFWKFSITPWKRVLLTRSIALIPSILVAILAKDYLDTLGEYLNTLQSLQLPFALIPLLALLGDVTVMGKQFVLSKTSLYAYYLVAVVLLGFNGFLIFNLFYHLAFNVYTAIPLTLFVAIYIGFIYKVVRCY
ncbi:Nramp-domain-containing protein [Neoconidiobolus thromboides FSU 785]|nr:Nramp-domain-containing protein [Neoconidiobolus thromboides FSU 785]